MFWFLNFFLQINPYKCDHQNHVHLFYFTDIEIQAPYQNRICSSNSKFTAYFELRAKEFKPNDTRECYLTAVYVNIYLLDADNKCIVQHVDLDRFSWYFSHFFKFEN